MRDKDLEKLVMLAGKAKRQNHNGKAKDMIRHDLGKYIIDSCAIQDRVLKKVVQNPTVTVKRKLGNFDEKEYIKLMNKLAELDKSVQSGIKDRLFEHKKFTEYVRDYICGIVSGLDLNSEENKSYGL